MVSTALSQISVLSLRRVGISISGHTFGLSPGTVSPSLTLIFFGDGEERGGSRAASSLPRPRFGALASSRSSPFTPWHLSLQAMSGRRFRLVPGRRRHEHFLRAARCCTLAEAAGRARNAVPNKHIERTGKGAKYTACDERQNYSLCRVLARARREGEREREPGLGQSRQG